MVNFTTAHFSTYANGRKLQEVRKYVAHLNIVALLTSEYHINEGFIMAVQNLI